MNQEMHEEKVQAMKEFLARMTKKEGDQPKNLDNSFPSEFVEFNPETEELTLEFPVTAWCLNHAGTLHGGLIATALDKTLGCVVCYRSKFTPTISLSINYILPVMEGDSLLVTASPSRVGAHIGAIAGTAVRKSDGKCVATAIGNYMIMH
jgi:uncharacterized protein (TIGR00369 family)